MQILLPSPEHIEPLRLAIGLVAAERIYLSRVEAPEKERFHAFMSNQLKQKFPLSVALDGNDIVGWADIAPFDHPLRCHRGVLGMGVIASHRGRKIGFRLLEHCLDQGPAAGLEKVELYVYTDNTGALKMYEKAGFERAGLVRQYRKLDGKYSDCVMMEKFLPKG